MNSPWGCLKGILILSVIIFGFYILLVVAGEFGRAGGLVLKIIIMVASFAVIPPLLREQRKNNVVKQLSANDLLEKDVRRPVLFLREFKHDGVENEQKAAEKLAPLFNPLGAGVAQIKTYEETYVMPFQVVGPIIALKGIGYQDEIGAARMAVEDEKWRTAFDDNLEKAKVVVIRAGMSDSIIWEFRRIVETNRPRSLVIFLQFGEEPDQTLQEARYKIFKRKFEHLFPKGLPDFKKSKYLVFDDNWQPEFCSGASDVLQYLGVPHESSMRYFLKQLLPYANYNLKSNLTMPFDETLTRFLHLSGTVDRTVLVPLAVMLAAFLGGALYAAVGLITENAVISLPFMLAGGVFGGVLIGKIGKNLRWKDPGTYVGWGIFASLVFLYGSWSVVFWGESFPLPHEVAEYIYLFTQLELTEEEGGLISTTWRVIIETGLTMLIFGLSSWGSGLSEFEHQNLTDAGLIGHDRLAPIKTSQPEL